jgi:hypothetical protein
MIVNDIKDFMKALIVISTLILSSSLFANRLYCTSSNSGQDCSFTDMKLYDQRIVSDMHCGPASGAMVLSALTYGNVEYLSNSWTAKNFVSKSVEDRIINMGNLMNTSSSDGTSLFGVRRLKKRARDFKSAKGYMNLSMFNTLNSHYLKRRVEAREIDLLNYGHYKEKCTDVGSYVACKYKRNGGHIVAIKGFKKINGITKTIINDPWNGITFNRKMKILNDATDIPLLDLRPYGNNTRMLRESGNRKKIIDLTVGIKTN